MHYYNRNETSYLNPVIARLSPIHIKDCSHGLSTSAKRFLLSSVQRQGKPLLASQLWKSLKQDPLGYHGASVTGLQEHERRKSMWLLF